MKGGVLMEKLHFDRLCKCDWCNQKEICAVCHIGTTNYNRLVCLECALSINENQRGRFGNNLVDLNNSTIDFSCIKENINEEE